MKSHCLTSRRGAILPLIAVMLPVLLILAGFAINIAYMQLSATEIQISTDIAARAAGRTFALTQDEGQALSIANDAGARNRVAGKPLKFAATDLVFGQSTRSGTNSRYSFTDTGGTSNAVKVIGNRTTSSADGHVKTFFPSILGTHGFSLSAMSVSTQMEVDIALVFDRSGSMAYADDEPAVYPPIPAAAPADWDFCDPAPNDSRWLDAVAATDLFLTKLNLSPLDEQVALVTYADNSLVDTPLTGVYGDIMAGLNFYTNSLCGGGTNIESGLQAGEAALTSADARGFSAKVAILMTDGRKTLGSDPVYRATKMAENGMMVICITFSDEADQVLMGKVAKAGNGFHLHAERKEDLNQVFDKIARMLPTLLTK